MLQNANAVICGGAKLNSAEQEWLFHTFGIRFHVVYGQTEVSGIVMDSVQDMSRYRISMIGKPMTGVHAFVDERGELFIESDCVCMGYAMCREDLAMGDENKGLIATGDLAEQDADGCFYLKGRVKRIVKILGRRFNLDEIENLLCKLAESVDFAYTGEQDELNVYYAAVGLQKTDNDIEKSCIEFLTGKLGIPFTMIHMHAVPQIPKSSAGKKLYYRLC